MSDLLVDDLDATVAAAVRALHEVADRDWHVTARDLAWTCWETLEHVADDLFAYAGQIVSPSTGAAEYVPFLYDAARDGGPEVTIRSRPDRGNRGLIEVLETCGAMLSTGVRARRPTAVDGTRTASQTLPGTPRWAPWRYSCTRTTSPSRST